MGVSKTHVLGPADSRDFQFQVGGDVMMRESNAKETVEYNVEPVVIAEACLDELNRIGKIKNI